MSKPLRDGVYKRAAEAMLVAPSYEEAAKIVGVHPKTIRRYRADPEFQIYLAQARKASIEEIARRVLSTQLKAIQKIETLMDEADRQDVQLKAATTLLQVGQAHIGLAQLEERMEELERMANGQAQHYETVE